MTILEIILAVSFGLFVVFAILVGIGAAVEQGNFLKRAKVAARIAKSAEATARMWRRCLDEQSKAHRELDLKVGKVTGRIRNAYLHERRLRRELDPESYHPGQGKQHGFIAQGLAEALKILEQETGWYKEEKEAPGLGYARTLRRKMAEERVGAPAHGPVTAPCAVCGGRACTYRWGQSISRWDSMSNVRRTFATTKYQDFDPNSEVGWFPVCTIHASILDEYGSMTLNSEGYHRG